MITTPEFVWDKGPSEWVFWDDFNDLSISATAGAAKWWLTETAAGATQLLSLTESCGVLNLTQTTNDNDVISIIANSGVKLTDMKAGEPLLFGCRLKTADVDDVDLHVGMGIQDASMQASAPADYIAFRLQEGGAGIDLVISKDSVVQVIDNFINMADGVYARCFWAYSPAASPDQDTGTLQYSFHSNGVVKRGTVDINGVFPDDVVIFPLVQAQNGSTDADLTAIDWIYAKATRALWVDGTG